MNLTWYLASMHIYTTHFKIRGAYDGGGGLRSNILTYNYKVEFFELDVVPYNLGNRISDCDLKCVFSNLFMKVNSSGWEMGLEGGGIGD